jgi:hypothetical protein
VGDFNARIHNDIGGEKHVFGSNCFGNPAYNPGQHPDANRELLLEFCVARELCVANTFLDNEPENAVTYHEIYRLPPLPPISPVLDDLMI